MSGWHRGTLRGTPSGDGRGPMVVKIGGSLLARPGWPAEVMVLLAEISPPWLVVAGGGRLVDALRAFDAAAPQPPELMHDLAIRCMGVTARLAAAALGLPLVVEADPAAPATVLDTAAWLGHAGRLAALPVGWHVTSDSIAAAVAADGGGRLFLVKSVPPPCPGPDLTALAAAGWVDDFFPMAAALLAEVHWAAPNDA
jgi:5-(aminomethyl)-3-furanmethanol phosphate kinase